LKLLTAGDVDLVDVDRAALLRRDGI